MNLSVIFLRLHGQLQIEPSADLTPIHLGHDVIEAVAFLYTPLGLNSKIRVFFDDAPATSRSNIVHYTQAEKLGIGRLSKRVTKHHDRESPFKRNILNRFVATGGVLESTCVELYSRRRSSLRQREAPHFPQIRERKKKLTAAKKHSADARRLDTLGRRGDTKLRATVELGRLRVR
jgi:hypothetical protein